MDHSVNEHGISPDEVRTSLYPGPVRASILVAIALHGMRPADTPEPVRTAIESFPGGDRIAGAAAITNGTPPEYLDGKVGTDLATPMAELVLSEVPAILVTAPGDHRACDRYRRADELLLAAEQVGGAEGCLTRMVDYAKVREQFGKPIGAYQAIAHHCAKTAVANAAAKALVTAAAEALGDSTSLWDGPAPQDTGTEDDEQMHAPLVLLACAEAADQFRTASSTLIQVAGGIGFTWEHDGHLCFRRARATAGYHGTPAELRDRAVADGCLDLLTRGRMS